jgi:ubiquinone/menaquinone biosynthesis C-methylase UbiE
MSAAPTWQLYDGSAETYERYRPTYPTATLETLKSRLGSRVHAGKALDAGAGTGIFSRQLLSALPELAEVACVEPNEDMLRVGMRACAAFPQIRYQRGFAEALPVADGVFVLVTASAAANWFDRPRFLREVVRVLVAGGLLALLQNKPRYWDNRLVAGLCEFQERCIPNYRRGTYSDFKGGYGPADFAAELRETPACENVIKHSFDWEQRMTPEEFRGFCYSMGHIKKAQAAIGAPAVAAELDGLIERNLDRDGRLSFGWSAELTMAETRA